METSPQTAPTRPTLQYESEGFVRERHGRFVFTSWCTGARQKASALEDLIASPDTQCLVAHRPGDHHTLYGWAARTLVGNRWALVWAYTRDLFGRTRHRRLMTSLLLELGLDPAWPVPCLYWSPDASAIAARGYRLVYAPKDWATRWDIPAVKEAA